MAFFNAEQLAGLADFYDELIESFGVSCKLVYIHKFVANENNLQFANPIFAQNTGMHGGPVPAETSQTGGENLVAQESSENINLVVDWTLKNDKLFGKTVTQPYAIIRTHGALTDLPKIQKAISMEVNLPGQPITRGVYRVLGQGDDIFSIVKGKHFNCYWERVS